MSREQTTGQEGTAVFTRRMEAERHMDCAQWMSRMMGGRKAWMSEDERSHAAKKGDLGRKLEGIGWGLFFIWVGLTLWADFNPGVALVGVGLITLGGQAARGFFELKLEGFWCVVGIGFLVGGMWQLAEFGQPFWPLLIIIVGLWVLTTSILPPRMRRRFD